MLLIYFTFKEDNVLPRLADKLALAQTGIKNTDFSCIYLLSKNMAIECLLRSKGCIRQTHSSFIKNISLAFLLFLHLKFLRLRHPSECVYSRVKVVLYVKLYLSGNDRVSSEHGN